MSLRSVSGVEKASFVPFSAQLRAKSGLLISLSLARARVRARALLIYIGADGREFFIWMRR